MAAGGFGPYLSLWAGNTPSKRIVVNPTPWAMMPALGFVPYHRLRELWRTPPQRRICRFYFLDGGVERCPKYGGVECYGGHRGCCRRRGRGRGRGRERERGEDDRGLENDNAAAPPSSALVDGGLDDARA